MTKDVRAELKQRILEVWNEVGMDVMRTMQDLGEEHDEESIADGVVDMACDRFRPSYRRNEPWAWAWEDMNACERIELVGQTLFGWVR